MSISDAELLWRRAENAKIYPRFPLGDSSADQSSLPSGNAVAVVRRPTRKLRNESVDRIPLRLLILKKGVFSDTVECELKVANLQGSPDYEALSYVWGDSKDLVEIKCCGQTFSIGQNLHSALKHLRSPTGDRVLWVDAIASTKQTDRNAQSRSLSWGGYMALLVKPWCGWVSPRKTSWLSIPLPN